MIVRAIADYSISTAASNSMCLSELHVATCAALNLVCLHKATLPGNTPC